MSQATQAEAVETLIIDVSPDYVARLVIDFRTSPPLLLSAAIVPESEAEPVAEPEPEPAEVPAEPVAESQPVPEAEPEPVAVATPAEVASILVPAAAFGRAIVRLGKVARKKSPRKVLTGVRLTIDGGALFIDATDIELELGEIIDGVGADGSGVAVVSLERLQAAAKSNGRGEFQRIAIVADGGAVRVGRVTVATLCDVTEYPEPMAAAATVATSLQSGADFRAALAATIPAADRESSRFALAGVYVSLTRGGGFEAVATDGRRLHVFTIAAAPDILAPVDEPQPEPVAAIVPIAAAKLALDCAKAAGSVVIEVIADTADAAPSIVRFAFFGCDRQELSTLTARLVAGRYPRYRDAFPSDGYTFATVEPESFAALAAQALPVAKLAATDSGDNPSVTVIAGRDVVTLAVPAAGYSAEVPAGRDDIAPFEAHYIAAYLADAAKAATLETATTSALADLRTAANGCLVIACGRFSSVTMPLTKNSAAKAEAV